MRYEKGTMELSPARDILCCSRSCVRDSLPEINCTSSCAGTDGRFPAGIRSPVRRLVGHGLIEKRPGLARGRHQVYSISKDGASVLIDAGELFAGRRNVDVVKHSCAHWLELNEVHLALWRSRALVRWTPAPKSARRISPATGTRKITTRWWRSAVMVARRVLRSSTNERLRRLGLTGKLPTALEDETLVDTVLYLASNYHLMCIVGIASRHNECECASDWAPSSWASCFEPL